VHGHVQVEQDQVEVVVRSGQPALSRSAVSITSLPETIADDVVDGFAKQRVIVGNQNFVHGLSPCFY
jgi:hypothetical protein